mgnify:CR=1 FL=1
MSVKIYMPVSMYRYTNNVRVVELEGSTVGECLQQLIVKFPDVRKAIFTSEGKMVRQLGVYLNMISLREDVLAAPVEDGDEIHLIFVLAGG